MLAIVTFLSHGDGVVQESRYPREIAGFWLKRLVTHHRHRLQLR